VRNSIHKNRKDSPQMTRDVERNFLNVLAAYIPVMSTKLIHP
jgi:hypothetical protein